ncbi:MAG: hypothetical protein HY619_03040 [Thaumarchaeota archaeon]|nr:hypothetical protein [Nitrososphaerota archaeon]
MGKWITIAPVRYFGEHKDFSQPFDLGCGVSLLEIPPWMKEDKKVQEILDFGNREFLNDCKLALQISYEAEHIGEEQRRALTQIQLANLAVWIAEPSQFSFQFVVDYEQREDSSWIWRGITSMNRLWPRQEYIANRLTITKLEDARQLNAALFNLDKSGAPWKAIQLLWRALTDESFEVRYLLIWMGLEAAFGTDTELSFRISQRIAFFVAGDAQEARELFKVARQGYELRSKIAHGSPLTSKQEKGNPDQLLVDSENLLRKGIIRILSDQNLPSTFSKRESRDRYLDALPFHPYRKSSEQDDPPMPKTIKEIEAFFQKYIFGFIFSDIQKCIVDAKANYVVALSLLSYTDFMGGLITGKLGLEGNSKTNFNAMLETFEWKGDQNYYKDFKVSYVEKPGAKSKTLGIYEIFRCGLVHEYFVKGDCCVHNEPSYLPEDDKGIDWVPVYRVEHLRFHCNAYFRDFKKAADKLYKILVEQQDQKAIGTFSQAVARLEARKLAKVT